MIIDSNTSGLAPLRRVPLAVFTPMLAETEMWAHEGGFLDRHFVMDGDAVLAKNQLNSEKVINR